MMKKICILLVLSLSVFCISCDDTGNNTPNYANDSASNDDIASIDTGTNDGTSAAISLSDKEKAAYGLAVISEGLENVSWTDLDSMINNKSSAASNFSMGITDPISIPLGTLYNADGMKIDAALVMGWKEGIGIGLTIDLTNYQAPTIDGSEVSVCGEIDLVIAYKSEYLIDQNIVIYADTPLDDQLVFTGGLMDGQKIGLDNVEMKFNFSELNIGSPVVVKGTVLVNDFPLYVDSEIIELLMNFL
ncbi:MAG TPA: hypothetical protein PK926_08095 [Spirochaetota bacterium]|nr:hypothetical protein [Spirochaetota bacterium]HPI88530.1 hypothetical protein [Spirochaetota bacterium]HPR48010.1 hypothetical protein [Spirochaetota bacterium]